MFIGALSIRKCYEDEELRAINYVVHAPKVFPTLRLHLNNLYSEEVQLTNDAHNIEAPVCINIVYLKGVKEIRNHKGEYVDQKLANKEFSRGFKLGLDDVLDGPL
jgi:hypothetical protein